MVCYMAVKVNAPIYPFIEINKKEYSVRIPTCMRNSVYSLLVESLKSIIFILKFRSGIWGLYGDYGSY